MLLPTFFFILFLTLPSFSASRSPLLRRRCPRGFYPTPKACLPCPAGFYREVLFPAHFPRTCTPCPPGTFAPISGTGHRKACLPCPLNTFNPVGGAFTCNPCEAGFGAYKNATRCVRCPLGSRPKVGGKGCVKCAFGSFNGVRGGSECTPCPGAMTTKVRGAKSLEQCIWYPAGIEDSGFSDGNTQKCRPGSANSIPGGICLDCGPGTFAAGRGAKICRKCPKGTRSEKNLASKKCLSCGKGGTAKGKGNSVCRKVGEKCPNGTFEDAIGDCRKCRTGEKVNLLKKICEKCPEGSVSVGGLNTLCVQCKNGQIPSQNREFCGCPRGKETDEKGGCQLCQKGWFNPFLFPSRQGCLNCLYGTFADMRGALSCKKCPFGTFAKNAMAERCLPCPEGYVEHILGSLRGKTCMSPGTGCEMGFVKRISSGSFLGSTADNCRRVVCNKDTPKELVGTTCIPCEAGNELDKSGKKCA